MTEQSSSSTADVCSACRYCWRRKIKCIDSINGCEACKIAGVECIPRARGQTGRPRGSRKHSWRIKTSTTGRQSGRAADCMNDTVTQHALPSSPPLPPRAALDSDADVYSTFLLHQPDALSSKVTATSAPAPTAHVASIFPSIFDHYLSLYNLSQSFAGGERAQDSLVSRLEHLSELVRSLTSHGTPFSVDDGGASTLLQWSLQDSTLLLLFLTVLRAIEVSKLLLPDEMPQQILDLATIAEDSQLFDMATAESFLWHDLNMLTPHTSMTDHPTEAATAFDGMTTATNITTPRHMILSRLDMVLFDFSRFERRFSQLLMADGDHGQQELRAKLGQQNEQCLSSLRVLHSRIHDHLHTVQQ